MTSCEIFAYFRVRLAWVRRRHGRISVTVKVSTADSGDSHAGHFSRPSVLIEVRHIHAALSTSNSISRSSRMLGLLNALVRIGQFRNMFSDHFCWRTVDMVKASSLDDALSVACVPRAGHVYSALDRAGGRCPARSVRRQRAVSSFCLTTRWNQCSARTIRPYTVLWTRSLPPHCIS